VKTTSAQKPLPLLGFHVFRNSPRSACHSFSFSLFFFPSFPTLLFLHTNLRRHVRPRRLSLHVLYFLSSDRTISFLSPPLPPPPRLLRRAETSFKLDVLKRAANSFSFHPPPPPPLGGFGGKEDTRRDTVQPTPFSPLPLSPPPPNASDQVLLAKSKKALRNGSLHPCFHHLCSAPSPLPFFFFFSPLFFSPCATVQLVLLWKNALRRTKDSLSGPTSPFPPPPPPPPFFFFSPHHTPKAPGK